MALDGIFLNCLKDELKQNLIGTKIDKVYQPSKEEIVLSMRTKGFSTKLLLSARANSPRINLTQTKYENPSTPPMLCMLLRKHLTGAILNDIRQVGLDRILFLNFDATNEIGDKVKLTICAEIMGQYSNIIIIDENNRIIDSLKRIDLTKSTVRQVLPGFEYKLPPQQDKINILKQSSKEALDKILSFENKTISSAILNSLMGVSPIVCRELAFKSCGDDINVCDITENQKDILIEQFDYLRYIVMKKEYCPTIVINEMRKPLDFSFINIHQYGSLATAKNIESFSELLDTFYSQKDKIESMLKRSQDLRKHLNVLLERTIKKIDIQKNELKKCDNREMLRVFAELISANQYSLEKGSLYYDLQNYYDNDNIVRIPADPALTPLQNSQKYYKDYKKSYTAEKKLKEQIEFGQEELKYIDSVLDSLSRIDNEKELNEIRQELYDLGYIKSKKNINKKKRPTPLPPIKYKSSDGFDILVGRNNTQNDKLSLKTASKMDLWLHTQDYPGSHVVIVSNNKEISTIALNEAANIAAVHSKASNSTQVPIDYTLVKNLKKPNGAKPGKVIYHVYNTLYITPDHELSNKLKVQ